MHTFKVGKTYSTRSVCDQDCVFSFQVMARTDKTVTIKPCRGGEVRRKVRVFDGVERMDPHGRYSMFPFLSADQVA
jgi:hypothetical protein